MTGMRTQFPFTLPKGYVDAEGNVHRRGTMRLATARDEIEPLRDQRVAGPDDPLLTVIVLSRVIIQLGGISNVTTKDIEGLFAVDLAYLQDLYGVVNFGTDDDIDAFLRSSNGEPEGGASPSSGEAPPAEPDVDEAEPRPRGRRAAIEEVRSADR